MAFVVLLYRWFGKQGLYGYVVLAVIACNIQVVKLVDIGPYAVTLGNILYGSIFLTTDIMVEVHGKKEAQKAVWLGFAAMLLFTVYMKYAIWLKPSAFDAAQPHLEAIFNVLPRITVASLTAYLCSQMHDLWAFTLIRKYTGRPMLWLRNNAAALVSQAIDTTVFTLLAFTPLHALKDTPGFASWAVVPGFESWSTVLTVWWTTYLIKVIVSVSDTPFVYWGRSIGHKMYGTEMGAPLAAAPLRSGIELAAGL
ncbi:queuosine precursor transporter [bacterium]|nr:queuosine precursor transporter [bacterium]